VHSTPPTNTPIDTTRRCFLNIVARAAVAAAIPTGAAALPAMPAAAPASAACAIDPAFALIRAKRLADVKHCWAIEAQNVAALRHGISSEAHWEASDRCEAACVAEQEADWKLATTRPTTLAGVVAVLQLANLIEDEGGEWPDTDTIGRDGWHYQLRATMAAAVEDLIKAQAGKAVRS
jgi:hypothetical protein